MVQNRGGGIWFSLGARVLTKELLLLSLRHMLQFSAYGIAGGYALVQCLGARLVSMSACFSAVSCSIRQHGAMLQFSMPCGAAYPSENEVWFARGHAVVSWTRFSSKRFKLKKRFQFSSVCVAVWHTRAEILARPQFGTCDMTLYTSPRISMRLSQRYKALN